MSVNSTFNSKTAKTLCGIALAGIKTNVKGPAPAMPADKDDIIDEALRLYRFNIIMKSFAIKGSADKTLVYLTVYINHLLQELAKA